MLVLRKASLAEFTVTPARQVVGIWKNDYQNYEWLFQVKNSKLGLACSTLIGIMRISSKGDCNLLLLTSLHPVCIRGSFRTINDCANMSSPFSNQSFSTSSFKVMSADCNIRCWKKWFDSCLTLSTLRAHYSDRCFSCSTFFLFSNFFGLNFNPHARSAKSHAIVHYGNLPSSTLFGLNFVHMQVQQNYMPRLHFGNLILTGSCPFISNEGHDLAYLQIICVQLDMLPCICSCWTPLELEKWVG